MDFLDEENSLYLCQVKEKILSLNAKSVLCFLLTMNKLNIRIMQPT